MAKIRLPRKDFQWSSDLAYAVGLITTDGNLSKDKRHISLTSTDTQLLETFRKCLNKKNIISVDPSSVISKKPAFRIQIGDVVLYDWLTKIGLKANKSLTLGNLKIEDRYFPDFVRGHLDGDGSVIHYIDRYNTNINKKYIYERIFVYFRSASKSHIYWLRSQISKLIGIKGALIKEKPRNGLSKTTMYLLKFSTKEAKVILNWIYYKVGLPCLLRKYTKANAVMKLTTGK